MKNTTIIFGNKKATVEGCFDVSVESGLAAWLPIRELSFLIVALSSITKTLSTALLYDTCGVLAVPSKMISQWTNICLQPLTGVETSEKTAEGELTANQDDKRCWIIASNIGYGCATNKLP